MREVVNTCISARTGRNKNYIGDYIMEFKMPELYPNIDWTERIKLFERLRKASIIDEITGCYLWQKYKNHEGYGRIYYRGTNLNVHRLAGYIYFVTIIGDKSILMCHKPICPNKSCWNPEHIYEGNTSSNTIDSITTKTYANLQGNKTQCNWGHEFTSENTYIRPDGYRDCKTCRKARHDGWRKGDIR